MTRRAADRDERAAGDGHRSDADVADDSGPPAVSVRDLEVTYSDGTEAVTGIDLTVPQGEFFGFLGPNGAGKTTTIKVLATLLSPTGGEVAVNGFDVTTEARKVRQSIGYMSQETSIDPELTGAENVRFACEAYGVPRGGRDERIGELLDLVGLADAADRRAKEYSGGMKKRLDAATALVHRPPLVFLDEPTTGLDPKARNRLWDYFRAINDRGTTIFLTTQYLEEADQLCDRLSVIQAGDIVATDAPDALKSRVGGDVLDIVLDDPTDEELRRAEQVARDADAFEDGTVSGADDVLTVTSENARRAGPDLIVALREAGLAVTGFDVRSPTLDDVFLAITGEPTTDGDDAVAGGLADTGAGR